MPFVRRHATFVGFVEACLDIVCITAGHVFAAYWLSPGVTLSDLPEHVAEYAGQLAVFVFVWLGAAMDQRLFSSRRGETLWEQVLSIGKAVIVTIVFTGFLIVFFSRRSLDQEFLIYSGGITFVFILIYRTLGRLLIWRARTHGYNYRQILIIGGNERARHLVELMVSQGWHGYKLAGLLDDDPDRIRYLADYQVPYLGRLDDLEKILLTHIIDEVYVCLPVRAYYEKITSMAHLCEGIGTPIRMIADLFPLRVATSRVKQFGDIPLLSLSAVPEAEFQLFLKRAMDIAVSLLFLICVASWLFPIIALLIKLDSPGPVFFLQERVGLNGRRFKMIKFRSMVADAEERKRLLEAMNEADGPVFKMRQDPRVTRVGRWLRKFSLDEMPQFVNVLLGHMSLVGPRPPIPSEVEKYTWDQRRRLSVRPGLTGLQQVSGRSELSFDQWVELDLAYIDNWSLLLDFRILLRTFEAVVLARGAA